MAKGTSNKIKSTFEESISLKQKILNDNLHEVLLEIGDLIVHSILNGGKILLCGNGGSASDAQHLAAEFLVRLTSEVNRQGLPALSLVQDPSTFTACINDFSSDEVFSRNLRTLGNDRDILIAITTSGNSRNIINVLKEARHLNIKTVGFLGGDGGKALEYCDFSFVVPSNSTPRVQEMHITAGHAVLQFAEDKLFEKGFLEISDRK